MEEKKKKVGKKKNMKRDKNAQRCWKLTKPR